jgi:type II secretory pathway component GspD/PulD (secretin)
MNSIQYQSVGTNVQATPRIDTEGAVQVNLAYNASNIIKSPDVAIMKLQEQDEMMADVITTHQVNTSVRVKDGYAALVWSESTQDASDESGNDQTQLIILAADVSPLAD